jgi:hypothetical protein
MQNIKMTDIDRPDLPESFPLGWKSDIAAEMKCCGVSKYLSSR